MPWSGMMISVPGVPVSEKLSCGWITCIGLQGCWGQLSVASGDDKYELLYVIRLNIECDILFFMLSASILWQNFL